ncbi:hypothetical protein [Cellvibrio mixtus]|uniref:hypothetical protein n=1 Tax=Cellvibrio mixtus TaxID=39650 RepID=UPI0005869524|nr:hypothetical protein [Cellvibrio mixtus]
MKNEKYEILHRLHSAQGDLAYSLAVFGDTLAKREKYKNLGGMDAIHFYLIQKFHWLPRDVQSMSYEDIELVLHQEKEGWKLPKDAV